MVSEWKEVLLEELASDEPNALATGPFGSAISSKHFTDHGVPVIRGSNLSANISERLNDRDIVFLSCEKAKEFKRSIAKRGDLVFTCWGTINQVGFIDSRSRFDEYIVSNKQMKLTVNRGKVDPLFLYYLFSGPDKQAEILDNGIGSSVPGFNLGQLRKHSVLVPSLAEQRQIIETLGALDDKIALLRETNATLEAIAQALFKSWFVDFDAVRAKAEGRDPEGVSPEVANLFPSEFEDSELGVIPKGWRLGNLGEVVEIYDFKRVPLSGAERVKRRGPYPYYGAAALMDHVDDFLFDGTYLLMGEDGSVTNTDGTPILQYVWGKFWVNNHAHVLSGKKAVCTEHIMLSLKGTNISGFVTGAVQAKLNQGNLNRIPFLIPDPEVATIFAEEIQPLYASIRANQEQSTALSDLRDSLLPRLMSGKLRVSQVLV